LLKSMKVLISRIFQGSIHFPKDYSGQTFIMEDGKKFKVIRDLRVDPKISLENSAAIFKVRFKFSGLPLAVNKRLSMIPAPFLMAKSDFYEKIWTISDDGCFQGIYQWSSKDTAENYTNSFIYKLMTKRSTKGTLAYEVIPNTILSAYVQKLIR